MARMLDSKETVSFEELLMSEVAMTGEIQGDVRSSANYYWRGAWEDPRNKVYKLYFNQRPGDFRGFLRRLH